MAKYPEIQEKIREEVHNVDSFSVSDFNPDKLPWLCAVHSEVLRLNSPIQQHFRRCVKDVEINGIKFIKGDFVLVPVDALHTAEIYWGDNGNAFSPERFVDNPDLVKEWFYLPFGGGSRNCIGMRFALMQGRSCTAFLVKNFNIRFAKDFVDDVTMKVDALFGKASKPINLHFEKI